MRSGEQNQRRTDAEISICDIHVKERARIYAASVKKCCTLTDAAGHHPWNNNSLSGEERVPSHAQAHTRCGRAEEAMIPIALLTRIMLLRTLGGFVFTSVLVLLTLVTRFRKKTNKNEVITYFIMNVRKMTVLWLEYV